MLSKLSRCYHKALKIILQEWSKQSECSEVKGITKVHKNFTRLYIDVMVCICLSVCLSVKIKAMSFKFGKLLTI